MNKDRKRKSVIVELLTQHHESESLLRVCFFNLVRAVSGCICTPCKKRLSRFLQGVQEPIEILLEILSCFVLGDALVGVAPVMNRSHQEVVSLI